MLRFLLPCWDRAEPKTAKAVEGRATPSHKR